MSLARRHGGWVIVLSLFTAFLLTVQPLPHGLEPWRPDWVALVVLYWCLALPDRVGVGIAWLMGLMQDVLSGALLGQHALGLTIIAWVAVKLHQQIRLFPTWQQALTVMLLLLLNQLLVLWVNGLTGRPAHSGLYWAPSVLGMLLWPWLFALLRGLRRRYRVS